MPNSEDPPASQRPSNDSSGWQRGPDPDAPPWARGRQRDAADDASATHDSADDAHDPHDPQDPHDPHDADRSPRDPKAGEEHGDARELAVRRPPAPGRPPRRTGVFVDTDDLREHVGALLRVLLGGYEVDAFGNFTFVHDSARVFVTVGGSPMGPQVGVFSVTNLDVDLTPPLATLLLTTNHTLGFGAFSYDPPNRAVWLRHTLLGTTLDGPELHAAVVAVSTTAARFDDAIRDRFGGRTFHEAPDDVQRRVEPPETRDEPSGPPASGYL